ncbi:MAG: carbamoyl-phosphate synthase large subunit [Bradymonadia bacterium]
MPKRTDIHKILIIGSGPIVIGQACEFDYSGTQACKALRGEGYEVVLVNSNPATIMTDPETADRTYVEPITPEVVAKIIAEEKPDALLPTLGGQTALNTAVALAEMGALKEHGVEMIGARLESIHKAEDRELFKAAMEKIGLDMPRSGVARSMEDIRTIVETTGYPVILRPSFTMGGSGGNVARDRAELEEFGRWALTVSPTHEVLVDESIIGWKEYELEVMRDHNDNVVIICSIENLDPMGVHTGDSITVAPAQTLTDKEYQYLRDASVACVREIGVDTGGCNIQFGVCPDTGRVVVIEMNPRVSRSSALASKATGFPIAKIAALLAVGYTLDEIRNDITRETPASFEPSIDYVVTKIPRFTFEKFPGAEPILGTQMKSVGEAMAIGRSFPESFQKALRSMETGVCGLEPQLLTEAQAHANDPDDPAIAEARTLIREALKIPHPERPWYIADAMRAGMTDDELYDITFYDRWYLMHFRNILAAEDEIWGFRGRQDALDYATLRRAKRLGLSDRRIGQLLDLDEAEVFTLRTGLGVKPVYKRVDTCAAEFEAFTPYLYSTYEQEDEALPTDRPKVVILGGGPNRIGQGIEFDYCCVHAAFALSEAGYETIMVNCNPETVSTDYDTSDRLYFEPLTYEDTLSIIQREQPKGIIVQYGGQTPLKLAVPLEKAGVPILGTTPDAIDRAEDRERFKAMLDKLGLKQPANGIARSVEEAVEIADRVSYPVVVRPSYVLGGRAMERVNDEEGLRRYMREAVKVSPDHPVLIDRFVAGAIELDVDCIADGETVVVGGIMEHVEEAGVHSGDSACSLPPYSVPQKVIDEVERQAHALALELGVIGLMNIQFAVQLDGQGDGVVYLLEVNPRASRTVPFVSKAIGVPLAKLGARAMAGEKLTELGFTEKVVPTHVSVKEAVLPFVKFGGVDTVLGPEMKSTGEVMGIGDDFEVAFAKSQLAASTQLPTSGVVLMAAATVDRPAFVDLGRRLVEIGFTLMAVPADAEALGVAGVPVSPVAEGEGDRAVAAIRAKEVQLVLCTARDPAGVRNVRNLRVAALRNRVAYYTTLRGAEAAVRALESLARADIGVKSLQAHHNL